MTKDWERVRADACKYYAQGKSLTEVQSILKREQHFEASTRAFRSKLKEWRAKRAHRTISCDTSTQRHDNSALYRCLPVDFEEAKDIPQTSIHGALTPAYRPSSTTTTRTDSLCKWESQISPDEAMLPVVQTGFAFQGTLERLHERSADRAAVSFLCERDLCYGRSTLLHHLAAAGSQSSILRSVLGSVTASKLSVDITDQYGQTALHVAVRCDRSENIDALLHFGASPVERDQCGTSPLHISIISSWNLEAFSKLSEDAGARETPVLLPSNKAGPLPLDLAIRRLFEEFSAYSGQSPNYLPFHARSILLKLWPAAPEITASTKAYLRQLASKNINKAKTLTERLNGYPGLEPFRNLLKTAIDETCF